MELEVSRPTTIQELNISRRVLDELALKRLYYSGECNILDLSADLRVDESIVEEIFYRFRKDQLCEVTGMSGPLHRITLTSRGRERAIEYLSQNQYVGPVPVSLRDYHARVQAQSVTRLDIDSSKVEQALCGLVLDPAVVRKLGTAMASGRSIFLYGSTGSGKSSVAESLGWVLAEDKIHIPHAIEVDGQIIAVFDPAVHETVVEEEPADPRWVCCRRPRLLVGGELNIEMLDLDFNPTTKFFSAPVQLKANNGLLIVDDLGRQRIRPVELLNRWVVPLDRRIDFLTIVGGKKIEVPFDMFVVFATNLAPSDLVDEAFLRRLHTKIKLDTISTEQFHEIFRRVCDDTLQYDRALVDQLVTCIVNNGRPLRACYPRDIVNQVRWAARFDGQEPQLTWDALLQAYQNYFVDEREPDAIPKTERLGSKRVQS
jgi:predicted ATPase with chaperone activity